MITKILIVDDEVSVLESLKEPLEKEGYEVLTAGNGEAAIAAISETDISLVFLDYNLPDLTGLEIMEKIKQLSPSTIVIFITGQADVNLAVMAIKQGAYDFITKPFRLATIKASIEKAKKECVQRTEVEYLRKKLVETSYGEMIGKSTVMNQVYDLIEKVAKSPASTVLIHGESGTGKELVAKCLHEKSSRGKNSFVCINCSAIPESLLESELFGHEKGAFTDAKEAKRGLFEAASGGTIFLDEIGDMPLGLQAKLLRVLEERKIRRIGSEKQIDIDVRIITASHRDLQAMVNERTFRQDLFYRLNVVMISLPALKNRNGDLKMLINYFINKFSLEFKKEVKGITLEALNALCNYDFPGNVRELKNIIERALILCEGDLIDVNDLSEKIAPREKIEVEENTNLKAMNLIEEMDVPLMDYKRDIADQAEKQYILQLLRHYKGNVTHVAEKSGVLRTNLIRLMNKHKLKSVEFKNS